MEWLWTLRARFATAQDIDLEGFQAFMDTYLEMDTPRDLVKHLFLSFVRKPAPSRPPIADGRLLKVGLARPPRSWPPTDAVLCCDIQTT